MPASGGFFFRHRSPGTAGNNPKAIKKDAYRASLSYKSRLGASTSVWLFSYSETKIFLAQLLGEAEMVTEKEKSIEKRILEG